MKISERVEQYRIRGGFHDSPRHALYGAFLMPGPCAERLMIVACDGDVPDQALAGWEHVSVSTKRRLPNWTEMCFVKDQFWSAEDCVVQYHPPKSEYVNNHPNCLHLWKATQAVFPVPPSILVGIKSAGIIKNEAEALAVRAAAGL